MKKEIKELRKLKRYLDMYDNVYEEINEDIAEDEFEELQTRIHKNDGKYLNLQDFIDIADWKLRNASYYEFNMEQIRRKDGYKIKK